MLNRSRFYVKPKVSVRFASYPTIRVSSHMGCNLGCLHCKLTYVNGKKNLLPAKINDFQKQFHQGLDLLPSLLQLEYHKIANLKVDFSSKGEPLENDWIKNQWSTVTNLLQQTPLPFPIQFAIQTIMPDSFASLSLTQSFLKNNEKNTWPTFTYNMMSSNENVKYQWMNSAMPFHLAFIKFRDYQDGIYEETYDRELANSKVRIKLFLVEGVNDDPKEIQNTLSIMQKYGLKAKIELHPFLKPTLFLDYKPSSLEKVQMIASVIENENPEGVKICF